MQEKLRRRILFVLISLLGLCLLLVAGAALSNIGLPTRSPVIDRLSEDQKALLLELDQVRSKLGEAVWPGWGESDIPTIVYNEKYAFLVGYPEPPPGWQKVPAMTARGGPWQVTPDDLFDGRPYYRQELPATGETPEAFTVVVGDRWVTSMQTKTWMAISLRRQFEADLPAPIAAVLPYRLLQNLFLRGSDGYVSTLAHESFHAYQGMTVPERLAAAETAVRTQDRYPWEDTDLQADWQVELDLLAEALRAETPAETAGLAEQFLAQRQQRREAATLSAREINYERQREWLEGLARYVELEIWRQANTAVDYEPVAALAADPDFDGYGTFDRRWSQEIDQIGRMADDEGDGRFYYSGMAQAVILDRLMPGWKAQALDEVVFLEDLLATAVTLHQTN